MGFRDVRWLLLLIPGSWEMTPQAIVNDGIRCCYDKWQSSSVGLGRGEVDLLQTPSRCLLVSVGSVCF